MRETETASDGGTTTSLREHVAEELRALLGRRKMSATQLARHMGVSQAYIWRRLNGETAFDLDDLEKIASILAVDVLDLLPRDREGRLITTARDGVNPGQVSNVRKTRLTERPRPFGHPNRTAPRDTTRRPVRNSPAHAALVSGGVIPMRTDREQGVTYGA